MLTPKQIRNFGQTLIFVGFVSFLGTIVWWHRFYSDLLGDEVKMATECFYQTTEDCAAGNYVVSMISDTPTYRPEVLWAACIAMIVGLLIILLQHKETQGRLENK